MQKKHFIRFWVPVIMYGLLIFYISALPLTTVQRPPEIKDISHIDLLEHVGAYAFFAFLTWRALHHTKNHSSNAFFLAILISIFYGAINEFQQLFIPGRFFSVVDMAFNSLGSFTLLAFKKISNKFYLPAVLAPERCSCCFSSSKKR